MAQTLPGFVFNPLGNPAIFETDNISFDGNVTTLNVDGEVWIGSSTGNPAPATLSASNGITVTNGPNSIALSFNAANQVDPYKNVHFGMSPYSVLSSDYFISVDTSGGAVTILFPNTTTPFLSWVVKDRTGNAAANNITITTPGAIDTFNGAVTKVISTNFGFVQILYNGTNYELF